MDTYNVAEAKARLSEILERVIQGEEVLLTRRGKPVARVVPAARTSHNILGAGAHDPNINTDVLAQDDWWKPLPKDEEHAWYE
jgi:prevent-host-death family protein